MTYIPSYFMASLVPKGLDNPKQGLSRTNFCEIARADPDLSLETKRFTVHLSESGSTQVAEESRWPDPLLLHGAIYAGGITNPAIYLLG